MLKIYLMKLLLRIISLFKSDKYRHSQAYEDNFKYMDLNEKLWWGYKALVRQIERAEKGMGIEEYFKYQDLNFKPEDDFIPVSSMTITAGGDLNCSEVIRPDSTEYLFDDVKDFYFSGDIVCANLESPLDISKPESGVPRVCITAPELNTSAEMFEVFARGGRGVNFFATANNHSVDMGESGLAATLNFLDSKGYGHAGTSRTPEEQMDIPVVEKNGIKIAMLSYTYCLNGHDPIPGKEYMTNMIRLNRPDADITLIKEHVKAAHQKGADLVSAILHWSIEFETYPVQNIIDMGHRIMDECGVDIILGGHPHVAQPMEKYRFKDPFTKMDKNGFIVYSLGEFVSYNAFSRNSRLAFVLKLQISKGTESGAVITKLTSLTVLPIYTWVRIFKDGGSDYRLLDFIKIMKMLDQGYNPYCFNKKEINELKRLERLLYEKLLPQNHVCL